MLQDSHIFTSTPCMSVCMGVGFPRTGATDICELPCGCWELNLGPLEEQLLTTVPSLQLNSVFLLLLLLLRFACFILCAYKFCLQVCMDTTCMPGALPADPEEGTRPPGTGVTDVCEPLCEQWELSPGPQEQTHLFLTTKLLSACCFPPPSPDRQGLSV